MRRAAMMLLAALAAGAFVGSGTAWAHSEPDGEGTLLDHSLVLYGSPINSNAHDHYPLPVLTIGGGAGRYHGGAHVVAGERTPMANLFRTMAEREDIELEAFGDSSGLLEI